MLSQQCSEAFAKAGMKTDSLAEQRRPFCYKVVANVRFSGPNARIVITSLASLPRQRQRFLGYLQFASITTLRDSRRTLAIDIPAFDIHCGVGAGWILAENLVERDETFQFILPRGLRYMSEDANARGDALCGLAGLTVNEAVAFGRDLLQQNQLECRDQSANFVKFERSDLFKSDTESGELRLARMRIDPRQKRLRNGQHARQDFILARDILMGDKGKAGQRCEFIRHHAGCRGKLLRIVTEPE